MHRHYAVYLLANRPRGALYVGATSNLVQRVHQHKTGAADGFTKQYRIDRLVWFEVHGCPYEMVTRERRLKEWKRQWKIELIEEENPQWRDLYGALLG
jgi:putative endonuclease